MLDRVRTLSADDPHITQLREAAETAIYEANFDRAEELLNEASALDLAAAQELQALTTERMLSAAEAKAANGDLKMTQLTYADAADYYRQAAALVEPLPEGSEEYLVRYLNAWGRAFYEAGGYREAESPCARALALSERVLGVEHPQVAASCNNLAEIHRAQGRYSEAEPLYQRALALREQVLGTEHPDVAACCNNLAALYEVQGRYSEAEPLYQRALALSERALGAEHPQVAQCCNNLAWLYETQGRYSEAEPLYQRALGAEHPQVVTIRGNYATLLQATNRDEEAEKFKTQEHIIRADHN